MASDTDTANPDLRADRPDASAADRPTLSAERPAPAVDDGRLPHLLETSMREAARLGKRAARGAASRWRAFPTLTRRIVGINLVGLAALVIGVLYLNQLRNGLIEMRKQSLTGQASIIATAIADGAAIEDPESESRPRFATGAANAILTRLSEQTGMRAQLYDQSGRLRGDTRSLIVGQLEVDARRLPPIDAPGGVLGWIEEIYSELVRALLLQKPDLYIETPVAGISSDAEVYDALLGNISSAERINSGDELILSVAVPVQQLRGVMGALVLSTEGGDIDAIISSGRVEIMRVFLIAALASAVISILFATTIARPIKLLAQAAEKGGAQEGGKLNLARVRIPDYTARGDEIGDLSGAFRRMTDALYRRIEAIESFAADVAHEIKNPLTSLRSAVETMRLAKSESARERLLAVIEHDVARLDRLVTDISNASRLDAELVREEMAPLDLCALVRTVADVSSTNADKRGVRILVTLPETSLMVRGLESRLGQVLSNLIDNGVSFSPEGGALRVSAARQPDGDCRIAVEDDGPGVPPDNLHSIFERFYTERPSYEDFGQHSGLGLSISRQIVEAHRGRIWAENREDETGAVIGARFVVLLPA